MANKGYHFGTSGNTKLGRMLVFNKLAGSGMIDGCMGSCGKHCTGCYNPEDPMKSACYVFKSYRQYGKNTTNWHIQNTQGLRTEPNVVFDSLANQMSRMRVTRPVRIHASGEIETAEELLKWFWMAKKFPKFAFYIYTKNYEVVDEVSDWLRDCDLAGFNSAKFDLPMLAEEIERVRLAGKKVDVDLHEPLMVDVQNIYHTMEPRNLRAAYRFYCGGQDFDNAHTAEADTIATYEVLKGQLDKYPDQLKNDVKHLSSYVTKRCVDFAGQLIYNEAGDVVVNFGKSPVVLPDGREVPPETGLVGRTRNEK